MQLGSIVITPNTQRRETLVMLLWGKPATGKTVLASTAPGRKLWLLFDPAGTASLSKRSDVVVADFSGYKAAQLENLKQGGIVERDLIRALAAPEISTVVVDSLTSFGQLALSYAIVSGKANKGTFRATIESPGMTGYGVRTSMMLDFAQMVLRAAVDAGKHVIFICHETEKSDEAGQVNEITIALSGQTASVLPAKISEIWYVEDTGKQRLVYVRNHGMRRPMRSRMFLTPQGTTRFAWTYEQEAGTGGTIARWYDTWANAGFSKIDLPSD
jgi:hypothetical protein